MPHGSLPGMSGSAHDPTGHADDPQAGLVNQDRIIWGPDPGTRDDAHGGRITVRDVLVDAERRLAAAGVPSPSVDSASIVAHVLQVSRGHLFLQDALTDEQRLQVEQLVMRRLTRVPLQYLLGTVGFRRMDLVVGPGVFIPRPETELVVEAGVRELRECRERIAVDLCAGSGAIALSLATEVEGAVVYAVELSEEALTWTQRNVQAKADAIAARGSRLTVVHHDAASVADPDGPLASLVGKVDLVLSNPPYVPNAMVPRDPEVRDHEPKQALFGGVDGLDLIRGITRTALLLLRPGGLLVIEHADVQGVDAGVSGVPGLLASQRVSEELAPIIGAGAQEPCWTSIQDRIDLNSRPRFTMARRPGGSTGSGTS